MGNTVTYKSPNGYVGVLYGKSGFVVFDKNGTEVYRTSKRTFNYFGTFKKKVDGFPATLPL